MNQFAPDIASDAFSAFLALVLLAIALRCEPALGWRRCLRGRGGLRQPFRLALHCILRRLANLCGSVT